MMRGAAERRNTTRAQFPRFIIPLLLKLGDSLYRKRCRRSTEGCAAVGEAERKPAQPLTPSTTRPTSLQNLSRFSDTHA